METRVAIYARSSPDCLHSTEDQIAQLRAIAADRGWAVTKVFTDRPTTVRKGVDRRAGEAALIDVIRRADVEKVLLWSIDRVGRSLVELVGFLEMCRVADVSLWLDQENVDTETGNGLALFDVGGMLAFHLRQSRRDRILRGQAASRALSIRAGRPPISTAKVDKARQLLAAGKGVRQAARLAGISAASASRLKNSGVSAHRA